MTEAKQAQASSRMLRECPDCGLIQTMPSITLGSAITCVRCAKSLRHTWRNANLIALALSLTSLVLYCIAIWSPFITVDIIGQRRETTIISLPTALADDGMWELGVVVLLTAIILPGAKIGSVLFTLLGLRTLNPPTWLPLIFRQYQLIGPWAMVEVFLLGVFVAYTRVSAIATVGLGVALYALGGLMLTMVLTDYVLDKEGVWEDLAANGLCNSQPAATAAHDPIGCEHCGLLSNAQPGTPCMRCDTTLHHRKPDSATRTWALLAAAIICYVPANVYPVMTIVRLGQSNASTILGGVMELLAAGMWPLAVLVLFASILVPAFKLIGLIVMLLATHRESSWRLPARARLYRMIEFIGRWSMIDVFMLATLVGLVRSGKIGNITPGFGALCFCTVVVLTMFASATFDPRLMWDAALRRPAAKPATRASSVQTSHA